MLPITHLGHVGVLVPQRFDALQRPCMPQTAIEAWWVVGGVGPRLAICALVVPAVQIVKNVIESVQAEKLTLQHEGAINCDVSLVTA